MVEAAASTVESGVGNGDGDAAASRHAPTAQSPSERDGESPLDDTADGWDDWEEEDDSNGNGASEGKPRAVPSPTPDAKLPSSPPPQKDGTHAAARVRLDVCQFWWKGGGVVQPFRQSEKARQGLDKDWAEAPEAMRLVYDNWVTKGADTFVPHPMLPVVREMLELLLDNDRKDQYDQSVENQQSTPFLARWYTTRVRCICAQDDGPLASSTRFEFASILGELGLDRCGVNLRLKCKTVMELCVAGSVASLEMKNGDSEVASEAEIDQVPPIWGLYQTARNCWLLWQFERERHAMASSAEGTVPSLDTFESMARLDQLRALFRNVRMYWQDIDGQMVMNADGPAQFLDKMTRLVLPQIQESFEIKEWCEDLGGGVEDCLPLELCRELQSGTIRSESGMATLRHQGSLVWENSLAVFLVELSALQNGEGLLLSSVLFHASRPIAALKVEDRFIQHTPLLLESAVACIRYSANTSPTVWEAVSDNIIESLPAKTPNPGAVDDVMDDLQQQVDALETQLFCCEVLNRYGIYPQISLFDEAAQTHTTWVHDDDGSGGDHGGVDGEHKSNSNSDVGYGILEQICRQESLRDPALADAEWVVLEKDLFRLRKTAFPWIPASVIHRMFLEALLVAGAFPFAERMLLSGDTDGVFGTARERKAVIALLLSSAREFYNSSPSVEHPLFSKVRECLALLDVLRAEPPPPHTNENELVFDIEEERELQVEKDLVDGVSMLQDFGTPMPPLKVRLEEDKIRIVESILRLNPGAYYCESDVAPASSSRPGMALIVLSAKLGLHSSLDRSKVKMLVAEAAFSVGDYGSAGTWVAEVLRSLPCASGGSGSGSSENDNDNDNAIDHGRDDRRANSEDAHAGTSSSTGADGNAFHNTRVYDLALALVSCQDWSDVKARLLLCGTTLAQTAGPNMGPLLSWWELLNIELQSDLAFAVVDPEEKRKSKLAAARHVDAPTATTEAIISTAAALEMNKDSGGASGSELVLVSEGETRGGGCRKAEAAYRPPSNLQLGFFVSDNTLTTAAWQQAHRRLKEVETCIRLLNKSPGGAGSGSPSAKELLLHAAFYHRGVLLHRNHALLHSMGDDSTVQVIPHLTPHFVLCFYLYKFRCAFVLVACASVITKARGFSLS
jgi:hypothetical protein